MPSYFLYARKSTDVEDKQVLSIEAQLSELRSLAKSEGLGIKEEFIEKRTAKMPGRPIFTEMVKRIQKGEVHGIVCWKLDRLARNPVDGGQISWMLQQGTLQHIRTHDKSHYPNDNVLMMSVEFGMANQFILDLSANTKRGLREKVKRGEFPGIAPVGYINDVRTKTVVIDRKKSKIIRAAFELYSRGNQRLEDVSLFLAQNGIKSHFDNNAHKDRIRFILSNPFYCGLFKYAGELYEGRHTPIVEKRLWDKVQKVLVERGHPQKLVNDPKPLCGLMRCGECGRRITGEIQKSHTYYRCTKKNTVCSQKYIREEDLIPQLSELLSNHALPPEWAIEMEKCIENSKTDDARKTAAFVQDLREKAQDLSRKFDRLLDTYLTQDIERESYLKKRAKILSEKKSVEEQIARLEQTAENWLEPMREWIKTSVLLTETATNTDLIAKKTSLQQIFGSNIFLKNRRIEFIPTPPYALLREARVNFSEKDLSQIVAPNRGKCPNLLQGGNIAQLHYYPLITVRNFMLKWH
jgi:DNA invertase Pin-like site-specific DNA recombinase